MIFVIDFGSQTTHLIGRRIRDLGVDVEIIEPEQALVETKKRKPSGIILSGGPSSVYDKNAPTIDKKIFDLGIPILGICYGQQLLAHLLPGGETIKDKQREDGPATLVIDKPSIFLEGVSAHSRIWMSHGDTVVKPPTGFEFVAHSKSIPSAAMQNSKKKIYCVQFHPEVEHTEDGQIVLRNFIEKICKIKTSKRTLEIDEIIESIKEEIGDKNAIAAVSGGLDSTVVAALIAKAVGKQLIPIHVDNGLMRTGTAELVHKYFTKHLKVKPIILRTEKEFLTALKGKTDPEEKRKIIGKLYIDLFQKEVKKLKNVSFLVQGTIYSDVIESKGSRHASNIKSHHNVGGLPDTLHLDLIEPIREFYTDEVRKIAKMLSIPESIITQQPHPGPGHAVRILGEVTPDRLHKIQKADDIIVEEMKKTGWYKKLLHSFPVLTGAKSTSVMGDGRVFGEVIAIRTVVSKDRMTADWARIPYDMMQTLSSRIVNEVPGISRVVYDITTKPPATMEWE